MFAYYYRDMFVKFTTIIRRFGKKGEKSGWTYIEIPSDIAIKLKPNNKKSFRVKGKLDNFQFHRTALLPMGKGDFILPLKAEMRKAIGKQNGAMLNVQIEEDKSQFVFNQDFMLCLKEEPGAHSFFRKQPGSHQRYFSKWIDTAKTETTKAKRIAMAINALSRGFGFAQMLRENAGKKIN